ncbi:TetR/AcrR family transcriptional regulator [Aliiglaciecola sp. CAU 1673]|uniref:TetR/AcrR family transcriptional regulator n=1 Tax=Aliiglaciecola sp. CAU 1673 TaxID=3032595 RepID=UPI0023DB57A9|nr:TetR/AcrR family transcriptional regulator [Aliiglaciecola sp. CAU 1673]MDF2177062.1 TetR/AcrR family transcriptional regulator [Aliiglaciecola sp. CAU 1673]
MAQQKEKADKSLAPRNKPSQQRSIERRQQILEVAAELLERLGANDFTTIKIAEAVGISVGTLYHYFPNKEAILHAMGQHWLEQIEATLDQIAQEPWSNAGEFVDTFVTQMLALYRLQKGLLHLVQNLFALPHLMPLDERHDEVVIKHVIKGLVRLGYQKEESELERIGRAFHEVSHALLLVVVHQSKSRGEKTLADLRCLLTALLDRHALP